MSRARSRTTMTIAALAAWLGAAAATAAPPATAPRGTTTAAPRPAAARAAVRRSDRLPFDRDGASVWLVGAELRSDGRRTADAVIELRGTRIATVGGPELRAKIPAGARTIDVTGKIITPGIVAVDTGIGLVEIDAEGSTRDDAPSVADPVRAAFDASSAIHDDSALLDVNAIEGITSAAVTPQGGLVSGQVAWIDLVGAPSLVSRPQVAMRAHLGQSVAGSRAAALLELRELFDDVQFHRRNKGAYDRNQSRHLSAHRLDLEALVPVVDGRMPLVLSADGVADLRAAIALAKTGLRVVVIGGAQAWRLADELAAAKITVFVQPSNNLPGGLEDLGARIDNAAKLATAGVEVGLAVLGEAHNARNVTQEAGLAVSYGLDPDRALAAITSVPARAYGMDAHYGRVAPGLVANLVVWGGDPFELSQRPEQVWIRGNAIAMRSRQSALRDRYLPRVRR